MVAYFPKEQRNSHARANFLFFPHLSSSSHTHTDATTDTHTHTHTHTHFYFVFFSFILSSRSPSYDSMRIILGAQISRAQTSALRYRWCSDFSCLDFQCSDYSRSIFWAQISGTRSNTALLKGTEKLFHSMFIIQRETAAHSRQKFKKIKDLKKNSRIFLVQRELIFPFPTHRRHGLSLEFPLLERSLDAQK